MDYQDVHQIYVFFTSICNYGDQISRAFTEFPIVESLANTSRRDLLLSLNAAVQTLQQASILIEKESQERQHGSPAALFNDEALQFAQVLAEECLVAIERGRSLIMGKDNRRSHPRYWKSLVFTNIDGVKTFSIPDLDTTTFYKKLEYMEWWSSDICSQMTGVNNHLERTRLLLLLVTRVVSFHEVTEKLRSGSVTLESFVDYHTHVRRVALLACVSPPVGKIYHRTYGRGCGSANRYWSPSSGESSDSELSIRTSGLEHRKRERGRPPPPPPPTDWSSTHKYFPGPPTEEQPETFVDNPFTANPEHLVETPIITPARSHPPQYKEKEFQANLVDAKTIINEGGFLDEKLQGKMEDIGRETKFDIKVSSVLTPEAQLFQAPTSLASKIKSLFRSKKSLEAEMKLTLASEDATLSAFLIQNITFQKIPHSAIHSLEWTHMRTIVSQLDDNSWWKTFSDLTEQERFAVQAITGERTVTDLRARSIQIVNSELVVLKVLEQNRFTTWIRPNQEHRTILAIVREKLTATGTSGARSSGKDHNTDTVIGTFGMPSVPAPETLPYINPGQEHFNELDAPRTFHPPITFPPPPHLGFSEGFIPLPMPHVNYEDACPSPIPGTIESPDVTSNVPSDLAARRALTSLVAFTIQRVPSMEPLEPGTRIYQTWEQVSVVREISTTAVLQQRIAEFMARGDSIINISLLLDKAQGAQVKQIVKNLNQCEMDPRFQHTLVEISLLDLDNVLQAQQTQELTAEVIHIIVKRAPRVGERCSLIYHELMAKGLSLSRLSHPPMDEAKEFVVVSPRVEPRRRIITRIERSGNSSDSDRTSSTWTTESTNSYGRRRNRARKRKPMTDYGNSDSEDSDRERPVARWKVGNDPVSVVFNCTFNGKDVVQSLLKKWTPNAASVDMNESVDVKGKGKELEIDNKEENEKVFDKSD